MTTASLTGIRASASSKLFWIRTNRLLAWSMVISPAAQWAAGMRFWTGFWIDMAILLAHAVLSFALFGKPEDKSRAFSFSMHVMGFRSAGLSARNGFLLTGYRIALGGGASLVLAYGRYPVVMAAIAVFFFYPMLRLAVSIMQHIFLATRIATRRWRWGDSMSVALAVSIVVLYFDVSIINLWRSLR